MFYDMADMWWFTYGVLFLVLLLVPAAFSIVAALVVKVVATPMLPVLHLFAAIFALTYASSVIGFLLGSSRVGVVGAVLPALMAGFAALATRAVIERKVDLLTASVTAIVVGAFLTASTFLGIQHRLQDTLYQPHISTSDS